MDFNLFAVTRAPYFFCQRFFKCLIISALSISVYACQAANTHGSFQYHVVQSYWDMDDNAKATIDGNSPRPFYRPIPINPMKSITAVAPPALGARLTLVDPLHQLNTIKATTKIKIAVILPPPQQRPAAIRLLRDGFLTAFWQSSKQFRERVMIRVYEDRGAPHGAINQALKRKGVNYVLRLTLPNEIRDSDCRAVGQHALMAAVKDIHI